LSVVGILLAAGSASRFGSDKLLHPLPARHLKVEVERVIVPVRPASDALAKVLEAEGCEVVVCAQAAQGMGASLACAVAAAHEGEMRADGYIVALADMPFIRSSTIAAVRDALAAGAPLVAPYFRARRGHPVGLSARFRPQLERLASDEGARNIVAAHAAELVKIPVGDPGVLRDIDTPSDLAPPLVV
jgi:molybdenum cofactor cytidylyltransferase